MFAKWSIALEKGSSNPSTSADSARVLLCIEQHKDEIARNKRIYSFTTDQENQHRYWPTGARQSLEKENLYTMNLCPVKDKFITHKTKIMSAGSCFAFEMGKALCSGQHFSLKSTM